MYTELGIRKTCTKCGLDKPLLQFYKSKSERYGYTARCKLCTNEIRKQRYSVYADYVKRNSEKLREYRREYYANRRETDFGYRFTKNLRRSIRYGFREYSKTGKTRSCAEYGIDFAAIFEKVGPAPEGCHLDHIIPMLCFDFDNPEHIRLAYHPNNLQWLPEKENCSKSDFIDFGLILGNNDLEFIAKEIGILERRSEC